MNSRFILPTVLFAVFLAALVGAQSTNSTAKSWWLPSYAAELGCSVDFLTAQGNAVIAIAPNDSGAISPTLTALGSDKTQLQALSSGDWHDFSQFVHTTFDQDVKAARDAITSGRNALNDTQKQSLNASVTAAKAARDACVLAALKQRGSDEANEWNSEIARAGNGLANLSARGIDTSGMQGVLNSAGTVVVQPMLASVNAAVDEKGARAALQSYCLYDGCGLNGSVNFHLAARFDIARLGAILAWITPNATQYGINTSQAVSALQTANSTLNTVVGFNKYGPGQADLLWGQIRDAREAINDVIKGTAQARREAAQKQRWIAILNRLSGVIANLTPDAQKYGVDTSNATAAVAAANATINSNSTDDATRDSLKAAQQAVNELRQEINQARRQAMQNERKGREQNRTGGNPGPSNSSGAAGNSTA